jgi:hypothetical protein
MDKILRVISVVGFALCSVGLAGFEDPVLLGKVMKGSIEVEQVMATKTEFRNSVRAFFNRVSPDAYADLAMSHKDWIGLMPEIVDAKTTGANAGPTEVTYWLHLKIKYAVFNFDVYPEGKQTVTAGPDAVSEWTIHNEITNYKDDVNLVEEDVRLIPHQGGILVEDNLHVVLAKESPQASLAKKEIEKKWVALLSALRTKLGGNLDISY